MNLKKLSVMQLAAIVGGFFVLCIVAAIVIIKVMKRPPQQTVLAQHPVTMQEPAPQPAAQAPTATAPSAAAEQTPTAAPTTPTPAVQPTAAQPTLGQVASVPEFNPAPNAADQPKDTFGQRLNAARSDQQSANATEMKAQLAQINARLDALDSAMKEAAKSKPAEAAAPAGESNAQGIQIVHKPSARPSADADAEALQRAVRQASGMGLSVWSVVGDHVWAVDKSGASVEFTLGEPSKDDGSKSVTAPATAKHRLKKH